MDAQVKSRPDRVATSDLKTGRIDFFKGRYGFIIPDEGTADVFLRWTVADKCRIRETALTEGRRVKYRDREGDRGPNRQATYIELA